MKPVDVRRFASPAALRAWYALHHAQASQLWLAVAKKNASVDVVRYGDALDLALAFGWIDGFVGKLDDTHYALRFTPRKPRSNWSAVNVKRFGELAAEGRVTPAGQAAFDTRDPAISEERPAALTGAYAARLQKKRKAAAFFAAQPPGYQRQASWYVLSARTEPTRQRRLDALVAACERGERLAVAGGVAARQATAQAKAATSASTARSAQAAPSVKATKSAKATAPAKATSSVKAAKPAKRAESAKATVPRRTVKSA
jgi:uncharacterized protein YdeI (YjbR/CyaY-like superfamily)